MKTAVHSGRTPPLARAGSASFEDPVLQTVYQFLAWLAAGRSEVLEPFCRYTGERMEMFLPAARAALVSEVMLRHAAPPASVEPPVRPDHQVYLTIHLNEAIATLPAPWHEELAARVAGFGWAMPWHEITRTFIGNSAADPPAGLIEFESRPRFERRITLSDLPPGVLRALKIEGAWFVRHDCESSDELRFCGLSWPAGHSQWLKEGDWISAGTHRLEAADLECYGRHRGQPAEALYLHPRDWGVSISGEAANAIARFCWKNGWRLETTADSRAVLPSESLVLGGRKLSAARLIQEAVAGDTRRHWSLELTRATLRFPDGQSGLDDLTLALEAGDMVAVMGPSGCGKSTLMSVISGELELTSGTFRITGGQHRKPLFALVPQDDVLFPELTSAENLGFAAALRTALKVEPAAIDATLAAVGLEAKGSLRVGSVTDKVLSGGERKRLNIGLEWIGAPDALLLDEPTSGLSSADAESVMKILRHRADQGVLVMAVIHQPSREVFLKFDKVIVLDVGGRLAFFGRPEAARDYFAIHVAGAARQDWNPDAMLETLVGRRTTLDGGAQRRNFDPAFWKLRYSGVRARYEPLLIRRAGTGIEAAGASSPQPGKTRVAFTLLRRELLRRIRGWRSVLASCLISVALACIVAWVCRIVPQGGGDPFTGNRHLPAFCFLNVILVQFLALSLSVQELVKDRAHRLRERLVNVPGAFWLLAKLPGLAVQTSLQAALVVLAGAAILGLDYGRTGLWIALTLAAWASVALGLFVSALPKISERVALAAVPLLLVPQMILCGAVPFEFKDLAHLHWPFSPPVFPENTPAPPPWIAQGMPSRWAYQATICSLRDDPAILTTDELKPLFRTYNFARGLAETWRSDPAAFVGKLEEKSGRKLTENQVREEIALLVLNDKRSSAEVKEAFGDLVPDTSSLKPLRNEFFLGYAGSLFPETATFAGRKVSPAAEARLMLGLQALVLLAATAALMHLPPRAVTHLISKLRNSKTA